MTLMVSGCWCFRGIATKIHIDLKKKKIGQMLNAVGDLIGGLMLRFWIFVGRLQQKSMTFCKTFLVSRMAQIHAVAVFVFAYERRFVGGAHCTCGTMFCFVFKMSRWKQFVMDFIKTIVVVNTIWDFVFFPIGHTIAEASITGPGCTPPRTTRFVAPFATRNNKLELTWLIFQIQCFDVFGGARRMNETSLYTYFGKCWQTC